MTRVAERTPLQVTVGSTDGINLGALVAAITTGYRGPDGERVVARVGTGMDGLTPGMILLERV